MEFPESEETEADRDQQQKSDARTDHESIIEVSNFLYDETVPLDGRVGSLEPVEKPAAIAAPQKSAVRVFVTGDEVTRARAMGLAEDLTLLVEAYLNRPADEREKAPATPPSPQHRDLEIALHGLQLDPGEEAGLRHLMWQLVQDRLEME
jgi:hypothetical protein